MFRSEWHHKISDWAYTYLHPQSYWRRTFALTAVSITKARRHHFLCYTLWCTDRVSRQKFMNQTKLCYEYTPMGNIFLFLEGSESKADVQVSQAALQIRTRRNPLTISWTKNQGMFRTKWIWCHGVKAWQSWDQHIIWGPHCKYESLHCGSSSESSLFSPSHDRQWLAKRIYLRSRSLRAKKIFVVVSSNTDSFVFHTVESMPRASNATILWKVEDHVPQRQQFWDATG